ncbi:archaemetzincin [Verrucomicrobiaceae bacterium 227]
MKKSSLLLSLIVIPAILAFTPPTKEESKKAIGPTAWLADPLRRAFAYNDDFKAIPKPGFGDWLSSREEPGQTYPQFLASRPNKPGVAGRKIIYLQPIGIFPKSAPKIATLQKYLAAYFHPMEVKIPAAIDLEKNPGVGRREKFGQTQLNCLDVLDQLQTRVPRDAHVVMGVTMTDLFPGPDWNFVFGMARIKNRVGVFSFARYGDEPGLALKRATMIKR